MLRIYPRVLSACLIAALSACSNKPVTIEPASPNPPEDPALMEAPQGAVDEAGETASPEVVPAEEPPMPVDPNQLSPEDQTTLVTLGWVERVGSGLGVWVNVERQELVLIEGGTPIWTVPCATATNGTGSESGSEKTPLGWHTVSEKFGDGAVWGQVFRSRGATNEFWQPGGDVKEDLVLTRILWLDGLEPGKNQGTREDGVMVDSKRRYIYIHGTNGESEIGTPSSHGCVRMLNDDVITLFDRVPVGTPVLISENGGT